MSQVDDRRAEQVAATRNPEEGLAAASTIVLGNDARDQGPGREPVGHQGVATVPTLHFAHVTLRAGKEAVVNHRRGRAGPPVAAGRQVPARSLTPDSKEEPRMTRERIPAQAARAQNQAEKLPTAARSRALPPVNKCLNQAISRCAWLAPLASTMPRISGLAQSYMKS